MEYVRDFEAHWVEERNAYKNLIVSAFKIHHFWKYGCGWQQEIHREIEFGKAIKITLLEI
jgi:hypothetical protein